MRQDVSVASDQTPFLTCYPWVPGAGNGYGTKYTDAGTLPPTEAVAGSFASDTSAIVTATWGTPWIMAWPWTLGVGFGTKFADPGTLPGTVLAMSYAQFTPTNQAIVGCYNFNGGTGNGMIAYHWSGSGFGSTYSAPATGPGTFPQSTCLSTTAKVSSMDLVATNTGTTPHLQAWPWDDTSGFGAKYADPGSPAGGTVWAAFSPTGGDLAGAASFGTSIYAYTYTVGVGIGTLYSAPATPPPGACRGVVFSPLTGTDMLVAQAVGGASPPIGAYPWTTGVGFGTKYSDPSVEPPTGANSYCVTFTASGGDVLLAYNGGSVYTAGYIWNPGVGFGSKYSDPATSAGINGNACMVTPLVRGPGAALGIFGSLPSPATLAGLALTKAMMDNPTVSRRTTIGLPDGPRCTS